MERRVELDEGTAEWGWVDDDDDFAKEARRQNAIIREEYRTPTGDLDRRGERGPLGKKHDVGTDGEGKTRYMTVAEMVRRTGLGKGAIYARIGRGLVGSQLLAVHRHSYVTPEAGQP